jgi:hypothetical protein
MRTTFKSFSESTAADWKFLAGEFEAQQSRVVDQLVVMLSQMAPEGRLPVTRHEHSLQTASERSEMAAMTSMSFARCCMTSVTRCRRWAPGDRCCDYGALRVRG